MSEQDIEKECLICKIDVTESDEAVYKCPACPYSYHVECLRLWKSEIHSAVLVCLMCRTRVAVEIELPPEPRQSREPVLPNIPGLLNDGLSIINENSRALIMQAGFPPHEELQLLYYPHELTEMYLHVIQPPFSYDEGDWLTNNQANELIEFRLGRSIVETGTFLRRDGDILRHLPEDLRDMFENLRDDPHVIHAAWIGEHSEGELEANEEQPRPRWPRRLTYNPENTLTVWRIITPEFIQALRARGSGILTPELFRFDRVFGNSRDSDHERELELFQSRLDRASYFRIPWYVETWKVEPQSRRANAIYQGLHSLNVTWNPVDIVALLLESDRHRNVDYQLLRQRESDRRR